MYESFGTLPVLKITYKPHNPLQCYNFSTILLHFFQCSNLLTILDIPLTAPKIPLKSLWLELPCIQVSKFPYSPWNSLQLSKFLTIVEIEYRIKHNPWKLLQLSKFLTLKSLWLEIPYLNASLPSLKFLTIPKIPYNRWNLYDLKFLAYKCQNFLTVLEIPYNSQNSLQSLKSLWLEIPCVQVSKFPYNPWNSLQLSKFLTTLKIPYNPWNSLQLSNSLQLTKFLTILEIPYNSEYSLQSLKFLTTLKIPYNLWKSLQREIPILKLPCRPLNSLQLLKFLTIVEILMTRNSLNYMRFSLQSLNKNQAKFRTVKVITLSQLSILNINCSAIIIVNSNDSYLFYSVPFYLWFTFSCNLLAIKRYPLL